MQRHVIEIEDGTRLAFGLAGPDDGVPLLLCHGLGAAGAQFAADADWFAERGFRVLVPDLRGHGASTLPRAMTFETFSLARLRADLYAMLDHAGMPVVHWLGNSLGGILGLGAIEEQPQRVLSLTLFGTALALDLPAGGWTFPLLDRFPGRRIVAGLTARTTTRNLAARPLIADMLMQYNAAAVAHVANHVRHYDLTAAAEHWKGPGLILVGGLDHAVNRALLGQLPLLENKSNWRIERLPEGGHCGNLDVPEQWRAAVFNFLAARAG